MAVNDEVYDTLRDKYHSLVYREESLELQIKTLEAKLEKAIAVITYIKDTTGDVDSFEEADTYLKRRT